MPQEYYIGVDVGTGSTRACLVDPEGTILALADETIKTWQPKPEYYEQSTQNIWRALCSCVRSVIRKAGIPPKSVCGLAFDATCSLAVLHKPDDLPVCVTPGDHIGAVGSPSSTSDHSDTPNIILWLDHRPVAETAKINATGHPVLKYVGGSMNIEMEIPKVLWLKNNMSAEKFSQCRFFDLPDALTYLATGGAAAPVMSTPVGQNGTRSFCSVVCKQGYLPVGVDGSVTGWQPEFLESIGLAELSASDFAPLGGINGLNGTFLTAGHFAGMLSPTAAKEMSLHTGVAVGSGVIDAYAGWVGTVGASITDPTDSPAGNDVDHGQLCPNTSSVPNTSSAIATSSAPETVFTRLAAVAGTSTCHLVMSPDAVFVPGVWGPYRDVLFPDRWMAEGGQSATGELLRTLIDSHAAGPEARKLASDAGISVYQFLNLRIRKLAGLPEVNPSDVVAHEPVPLAPLLSLIKHTFLYPDFFGNRSPLADPLMRGVLVGLGSDQTSVDSVALRYLAGMEAIALQTHQIVHRMNQSGHQIQSIFMSGSLGLNEVLNRLIATACRMPVLLPTYPAAAVVQGAAMLGARAAATATQGVETDVGTTTDSTGTAAAPSVAAVAEAETSDTSSLWNIMKRMSKPATVVWPSRDKFVAKLLETKYSIFEDMAAQQQEWRTRVNRVVDQFH